MNIAAYNDIINDIFLNDRETRSLLKQYYQYEYITRGF
jgi:hypothetical protein